LSILVPLAARAEAVTDHLSDDAWGFVTVHNLQTANAKIEKLLGVFKELVPQPIPTPLQLAKAATGVGAGVNEQGDGMLMLLAPKEGLAAPTPAFVIPIADYAAFAESINADATGEACRVAVAGEEVLVAKRGSYAVFIDVDNRDRLDALLAAKTKTPASIEPLAPWLAKTDAAAALTPLGVKALTSLAKEGLAKQKAELEETFNDPQLAQTLREFKQGLEVWEAVLGFFGAELDAAGVGLALDDSSNIKLLTQLVLTKGGKLANTKRVEPGKQSPLAGYPDEPFIVAGGGPLPPTYADTGAKFMRAMLQKFPSPYGFQKLSDSDWKEAEEMWADSMRGLQSITGAMLLGEKDSPLFSNLYSIMKVDDSARYLKSYAESMKKWNDLLARTTIDIKLKYDISDVEVAGKKGLLVISDVAAAAGDENVPDFQAMLKAMIGEDGKTRLYLLPTDGNTVLMSMGGETQAAKAVERFGKSSGLADSSLVQTATKQLDPQAPWQAVVSPKGLVAWSKRLYDNVLAPIAGGGTLPIPEFPNTPPLAISVNFAEGRLSTELVWPVETTQGLVAYIKKVSQQ
jgi:hypothetical protein